MSRIIVVTWKPLRRITLFLAAIAIFSNILLWSTWQFQRPQPIQQSAILAGNTGLYYRTIADGSYPADGRQPANSLRDERPGGVDLARIVALLEQMQHDFPFNWSTFAALFNAAGMHDVQSSSNQGTTCMYEPLSVPPLDIEKNPSKCDPLALGKNVSLKKLGKGTQNFVWNIEDRPEEVVRFRSQSSNEDAEQIDLEAAQALSFLRPPYSQHFVRYHACTTCPLSALAGTTLSDPNARGDIHLDNELQWKSKQRVVCRLDRLGESRLLFPSSPHFKGVCYDVFKQAAQTNGTLSKLDDYNSCIKWLQAGLSGLLQAVAAVSEAYHEIGYLQMDIGELAMFRYFNGLLNIASRPVPQAIAKRDCRICYDLHRHGIGTLCTRPSYTNNQVLVFFDHSKSVLRDADGDFHFQWHLLRMQMSFLSGRLFANSFVWPKGPPGYERLWMIGCHSPPPAFCPCTHTALFGDTGWYLLFLIRARESKVGRTQVGHAKLDGEPFPVANALDLVAKVCTRCMATWQTTAALSEGVCDRAEVSTFPYERSDNAVLLGISENPRILSCFKRAHAMCASLATTDRAA